MLSGTSSQPHDADRARKVLARLPGQGLFAGHNWRIAPRPFPLDGAFVRELEGFGRIILQFYKATNLLYRQSVEGKQPAWIADWLERGKPERIIELQRHAAIRNEVPRVIRPDILLTDEGWAVTELDSVPGGIGLTAWMNETYHAIAGEDQDATARPIGGPRGMLDGFASIFGKAPHVRIVVSEESATYRPEMQWVADRLGSERFTVHGPDAMDFPDGDAVYRFFELFDVANVPAAGPLFQRLIEGAIRMTPAPRAFLEEKMLFALLWNRNLAGFWHRELGEGFLRRLQRVIPYTWMVDPSPLPPHAAIPELNITDWKQLEAMSQKDRQLILKVSGFSDQAWGARGVSLGSDLSSSEWGSAIEEAIREASTHPRVLQKFHKPKTVPITWFDVDSGVIHPMDGRARLCPYYFVSGEGDSRRATLSGVLATVCPADKKIIHGMRDAVMTSCSEA